MTILKKLGHETVGTRQLINIVMLIIDINYNIVTKLHNNN